MSKTEPWRPSRGKPKGSRVPDVVIVKDPSKPPTRDNIERVIEVKFPPDDFSDGQEQAYEEIAGPDRFTMFDPEGCGCPERKPKQEREVTAEDVAAVALLTLLVLVLILDDAAPGGQLDDAAIPPAIQRILSRLAPLLRGPAPVLP